jgi:hypothetical protein
MACAPVDGIAGHAVQIHLRGAARMAQAEALRDLLHQLGTDIVVARGRAIFPGGRAGPPPLSLI